MYTVHLYTAIHRLHWENLKVTVSIKKEVDIPRNILCHTVYCAPQKLLVNGPSGQCSHLDFHSPPEVQSVFLQLFQNAFFSGNTCS